MNLRTCTSSLANQSSFLGSIDLAGVGLPRERFTHGITDQMVCLICNLVSTDPVYLLCCHNTIYCYKCILADLKDNSLGTIICPVCSTPVKSRTLTRHDSLRHAIYNLKAVTCDYMTSGCSQLSTIETINDHIETCVYQPATCTNEKCRRKCLFKDWEWHVKVECPKRTTICVGSCHSLITADEIYTHDCDHVLEEFRKYQIEELETLCAVFRDETPGVLKPKEDTKLSDLVDEWHHQKQMDRLAESFSALKFKQMVLNEDDEVHDAFGHVVHHGKWRCSSLECNLPIQEHNVNQTYSDGKRHILFWDCCLSDRASSVSCDMVC